MPTIRIQKQKMFISLSVTLLESERIICLTNSGGSAYVKDWRKNSLSELPVTVTLDQVDQI